MILRQRNIVSTHNLAKEEKARSRHEIVVATQLPGNKKMWSRQKSSLLETKRGHDEAIPVAQFQSRLQHDASQEA